MRKDFELSLFWEHHFGQQLFERFDPFDFKGMCTYTLNQTHFFLNLKVPKCKDQ